MPRPGAYDPQIPIKLSQELGEHYHGYYGETSYVLMAGTVYSAQQRLVAAASRMRPGGTFSWIYAVYPLAPSHLAEGEFP